MINVHWLLHTILSVGNDKFNQQIELNATKQ